MIMFRNSIIYTLLLIAVVSSSNAIEFESKIVADNLRTVWEVLWGPDNHLWITERGGTISRINPENGDIINLITISEVFEDGERGLMGLALHPNFDSNPYAYVVYNTGSNNENTRIKIVRFTYDGNRLISPTTIIDNMKGWWNHNGSRLHIDNNLKLWFTIGDAAIKELAQDLRNVNGKLCRAELDGSIPLDNPFEDSYIWSYGHRNQQGLVFVGDKIYTSEHGASTNDEINLIYKGRNYGWPFVEGMCNTAQEIDFCQKNSVVEPIIPINPTSTMAIAGIDYYNHNLFPEWNNSLLITSLKSETLIVTKLNENGDSVIQRNEYFQNEYGRLRDVCVSPDGRVFLGTSNRDGRGSSKFANSMDKIIMLKPKLSNIIVDTKEFNISPNPASDVLTIQFNSLFDKTEINQENIRIFNTLGTDVSGLASTTNIQDDTLNLNITDLPNGFYFITIGNQISKFVKI